MLRGSSRSLVSSISVLIGIRSYVPFPYDYARTGSAEADPQRMLAAIEVFYGVREVPLAADGASTRERVFNTRRPAGRLKLVQHTTLIGRIIAIALHQGSPPPQLSFHRLPYGALS